MKIAEVKWKGGFPTRGVSAQEAYNALNTIRKKNKGKLTKDVVVAAAASKEHVLHAFFEWNDSIAAMEHRRLQAGKLLRSIEVVYEELPESSTRAFEVQSLSAADAGKTEYAPTVEVLSNTESRDRLIAEAIRFAMQFRRRFGHLRELDNVLSAIDEFIDEAEKKTLDMSPEAIIKRHTVTT